MRKSKKSISYDEEKVLELKKAMNETQNLRMYKRYSVILKHFEGYTNRAIAEMEDIGVHAIGNYVKSYKVKGIEGLVMKTSPGAPKKLTKEQEQRLIDVVTNNTPNEVGFYGMENWTIEIICEWIEINFNIVIKRSSMVGILNRLNLNYKRLIYDFKKQVK